MSDYTREEILKLIEENGGPGVLDLSRKDLSGIDLGREAIEAELEKARQSAPDETPIWYNRLIGGINLEGANLKEASLTHANLQGAHLGDADLQAASLVRADLQEANLRSAVLKGANLWFARLQGAYLKSADFQEANLKSANFKLADLWFAELQGSNLTSANLQETYLGGANFQEANLLYAKLQEAEVDDANFQGANLKYSQLEKVDLFYAKSLEGAYFYGAFLGDTRMRREQLGAAIGEELEGRLSEAKEAYLALKNNFAELGRYDDVAWAYRKERRMEKKCSAPWRARRFYGKSQLGDIVYWDSEDTRIQESTLPRWHPRVLWFYTRHTLKWLADWFVELLCGYGESLGLVLAWMLLVILGFAAYYQVSHAVVTSSQGAATSVWDHLIFSLGAFTTLQPTRLQAARPGAELLTTVQAIIGISLAGLLGFVAGNRIRRS